MNATHNPLSTHIQTASVLCVLELVIGALSLSVPSTALADGEEPLMWRVKALSGKVLYLVGTVHMGYDVTKEADPVILKTLDGAKTFVMETNIQASQNQLLSRMNLPEGQTLDTLIGPEAWAKLESLYGERAAALKTLQPWMVAVGLVQMMLPSSVLSIPMDLLLLQRAQGKGQVIDYLETPEFQLSMLEKTLDAKMLREMLLEYEEERANIKALLEAYRSGNLKALEAAVFKNEDEHPEMIEEMIHARNRDWIPKLEGYLGKHPSPIFVAVGAGHLVGPKGVVSLLKAKGLSVQRIPATK